MSLSESTTSELRSRLQELEDEGRSLRERIDKLGREREAIGILINGAPGPPEAVPVAKIVGGMPSSFAGRVRLALRHFVNPVSPTELAEFMAEWDYIVKKDWNSASELASGVNSELYRMSNSRNDVVERVGRGQYSIRSDTRGEDDADT